MKNNSFSTPDYSLRESDRAGRVLLRIRAGSGLEVVVPRGYDTSRVPGIVRSRRDWIEKAMARMRSLGLVRAPEETESPPSRVCLQALGEAYRVVYRESGRAGVRPAGQGLVEVSAPLGDKGLVFALLREFVRLRAKAGLPEMLARTARECGLRHGAVSVRKQRTRWGSCSAKGNISLNAKLLFLPADLVRYVLVHELCHTRHLNHSPAYWSLVEEKQPDFRQMEARLKAANRHVPAWMLL